MMVVSMTGYGYSNNVEREMNITTEIKTVNHRYCEINIRLPKEFTVLEEEIKRTVTNRIRRGKADILIQIDTNSIHNEKLDVNWELLDQYMKTFHAIEERYQIEKQVILTDLLSVPDLYGIQYTTTSIEHMKPIILRSVNEALDALYQMRKNEGASLEKDIVQRLILLEDTVNQLFQLVPEQVSSYRTRLIKLLNEVSEQGFDEQRILTEVALFADRINVDEELTRLKSHISQFHEILRENNTIGRKLDFLLQEMNREINTIGSKSNHLGISKKVVEIKSEIEKLREQVQNIE